MLSYQRVEDLCQRTTYLSFDRSAEDIISWYTFSRRRRTGWSSVSDRSRRLSLHTPWEMMYISSLRKESIRRRGSFRSNERHAFGPGISTVFVLAFFVSPQNRFPV